MCSGLATGYSYVWSPGSAESSMMPRYQIFTSALGKEVSKLNGDRLFKKKFFVAFFFAFYVYIYIITFFL